MNLDELTLGQVKELQALFSNQQQVSPSFPMMGKKVIVRTYTAGVWFGVLESKTGNEVIVKNARRMWKWWAKESISLSACAVHGINQGKSKIVESVPAVWLEAIEIIPCSDAAIKSIEGAENVKAG